MCPEFWSIKNVQPHSEVLITFYSHDNASPAKGNLHKHQNPSPGSLIYCIAMVQGIVNTHLSVQVESLSPAHYQRKWWLFDQPDPWYYQNFPIFHSHESSLSKSRVADMNDSVTETLPRRVEFISQKYKAFWRDLQVAIGLYYYIQNVYKPYHLSPQLALFLERYHPEMLFM